ncbi:MAG: MaoC family dehydratase [Rhodospirillaceae bacterium]|nr:MaoC family dehydratase [Rhodospirillaceae bacterium]
MTSLSALPTRVGENLPPSDWMTITQEMINDFARVTGDDQWIHTDPDRCRKESPYGMPVAHGLFVLSLIPKVMAAGPKWADFSSGVNYGCDKVRFPAPTCVGSRIRMHQTLKSADPLMNGAMKVTFIVTVEIEGEKNPCCYTEMIAVLFP